jgi:hypothetical protein
MLGWPSLWLLSLGQTRESDSPCKAKPVGGDEESVAIDAEHKPTAKNNLSFNYLAKRRLA